MSFSAAEFFIHFVMIDYVVSVPAAGRGLQIGRAVNMRDAQLAKIIRYGRGRIESKIRMQLQPICCYWNSRHS